MHMTESALPEQAANAIAIVPGVARATPIVYAPTMLERGERRTLVYLIGEDRSRRRCRSSPGGERVPARSSTRRWRS